jgi:hypothetical protein
MEQLLNSLQISFPTLMFTAGESFYWSPETNEVFYTDKGQVDGQLTWSLLHETAHALLSHQSYSADIELIKIEMAAWNKAVLIGELYDITIDEDHIQNCLDTYRDWLYRRSICPSCTTKCLQQTNSTQYHCFNCHTVWKVTPSRLCRSYRLVRNVKEPSLVFHANQGY